MLGFSRFVKIVWFCAIPGSPVLAGTVTAVFTSADEVPVEAANYVAAGSAVEISLGYAPATGDALTVVKNKGLSPINGQFNNLAQGQTVTLAYQGISFSFVANYFGGDGNDLVLEWRMRKLWSWGANNFGQLGNGTITSTTDTNLGPVIQSGALAGKTVTRVAAGTYYGLVLCSDGTLAVWGRIPGGPLSNNRPVPFSEAVPVEPSGALAGRTPVAIAAGGGHALALCSGGALVAWGSNDGGQVGDGSTVTRPAPVLVDLSGLPAGVRVVDIAAGGARSVARCSDGSLLVWGENSDGRLGLGDTNDRLVPASLSAGALAGRQVAGISAGGSHFLALCQDGSLVAWGNNTNGQVGNGATASASPPTDIGASGALKGKSVTAVSAGANHSLALCSDGTVAAWGLNNFGQLGIGSTVQSPLPVAVNIPGIFAGRAIAEIATGSEISMVRYKDGAVAAWGGNTGGQLADGTKTYRPKPVEITGFRTIAGGIPLAIAPAYGFGIALAAFAPSTSLATLTATVGGATAPLFQDGGGNYHMSGSPAAAEVTLAATPQDATATVTIDGTAVPAGTSSAPIPLSPGRTILVTVTAENSASVTYRVHPPGDISHAFVSSQSAAAVYGQYDATGWNAHLSLGFAPPVGTNLKVIDVTGPGFITGRFGNLAQGQRVDLPFGGRIYHFIANYHGGTGNDLVLEWAHRSVAGWGTNNLGQLGSAPLQKVREPVPMTDMGVLTGKTVIAIAAGALHSVALCADGTLAAWGGNDRIGVEGVSQSTIPIRVTATGALAGKTVVGISAANLTSAAVCSDGSVVSWGYNDNGELGNGTTTFSSVPVAVSLVGELASKRVTSVAVGGFHSVAVCSDGSVLAWGKNSQGQLGDGTTTTRLQPVLVSATGVLAGKTVVAVSAGLEYSLALCTDGTLAVWGAAVAQAAYGGAVRVPVAVDKIGILAGKKVVALSQASHSTPTVLCSDGTVVTWGSVGAPQRGNGGSNEMYPTLVTTDGALSGKSVTSVASGGSSSLAICDDGTVATWGYNNSGQLGNSALALYSAVPAPASITQNGVFTGARPLFAAVADHAIVVAAEPDDGYRGWAFDQETLSQKGPSADPDGDGISNLFEYVLLGDPNAPARAILPTVTADGANFVFSFDRNASSPGDTIQLLEHSADLLAWTSVPIESAPEVLLGVPDAAGRQRVTVTIPRGGQSALFGRLKVIRP